MEGSRRLPHLFISVALGFPVVIYIYIYIYIYISERQRAWMDYAAMAAAEAAGM